MDRKFLLDNDVSFRRYSDIYRRDPQGIHRYRGYSAIVLLLFSYFGACRPEGAITYRFLASLVTKNFSYNPSDRDY